MDFSKVTDSEAKKFLHSFFMHREINREFYRLVPETSYDFRMTAKSDSVRENLAHQINVQRVYLKRAHEGEAKFGADYDQTLKTKPKDDLLTLMDQKDQELIDFLSSSENLKKVVKVNYSPDPIPVLRNLWAMQEHEILHTGIIIALMDHLNIERFPALKQIWG